VGLVQLCHSNSRAGGREGARVERGGAGVIVVGERGCGL
jgi:hypothetical protein